jgi:predicted TIM-barrel fold metal-dependent hydrolase
METAAHVVRMMAGGVFDRHPTLQIIVGHPGESLAFMLLHRQLDAGANSGSRHGATSGFKLIERPVLPV